MIYLDNAATGGFKPKCVIDEVVWALENPANPARSSHAAALTAAEKVYSLRKSAAELFDFDRPERVIITKNCTESLNYAIFGSVKTGGHVITTTNEHNSVLRPLYSLKKKGLIDLTVINCPMGRAVTEAEIISAMRKNTYLVAISHVSNVTGAVADVKKIGERLKRSSVIFLVDGAQSAGYLDVKCQEYGIDILCLPTHKGLNSPSGAGLLLVGEKVELNPIILGGTGINGLDVTQPSVFPEGFESGTLPFPSIVGAVAGLRYTAVHRDKIREKMQKFSDILYKRAYPENVKIKSYPNLTGIFTFLIEGVDSSVIAETLDEKYDIAVRSGYFCAPYIHKQLGSLESGLTRASFSSFNTFTDAEVFIDAVEKIAKSR